MKIAVVYSKANGNTMALANCALKVIGKGQVKYFGEPCDKALDADIIYLGFWTDKGTADEVASEFMKKLNNKNIFLFGSAGFGGDPNYFVKILNSAKENLNKTNSIIGEFMCQGKMNMSVRDRYVSLKESGKAPNNIDVLIENFDKALSHPNENDFNDLKFELEKTL